MRSLFDTVGDLEQAMTFNRERQTVIAGNLANLDTPGYRARDLAPDRTAGGAEPFQLARTDPQHIAGASPGDPAGSSVILDPADKGSDGNSVSLEREMAKLDANRVRYSTSAELVSRRLALLRYAASDGNG